MREPRINHKDFWYTKIYLMEQRSNGMGSGGAAALARLHGGGDRSGQDNCIFALKRGDCHAHAGGTFEAKALTRRDGHPAAIRFCTSRLLRTLEPIRLSRSGRAR